MYISNSNKNVKKIVIKRKKYILYSPENKHPLKISTPCPHYDEFDQNYEDIGRHYVQKRGAYFRDYMVL
jgi:hypothetical protein